MTRPADVHPPSEAGRTLSGTPGQGAKQSPRPQDKMVRRPQDKAVRRPEDK